MIFNQQFLALFATMSLVFSNVDGRPANILEGHHCDVSKQNLLSNNITSIFCNESGDQTEFHSVALEECSAVMTYFDGEFDNEAADLLAKMMAGIDSPMELKVVAIIDTDIDDEGAMAIAEAISLADIPLLSEIWMKNNDIGDDGATALASAISGIKSINQLGMSGNAIGDAGAIALAKAIVDVSDLYAIGLGRNQITDEGAAALAESIARMCSIEVLHLNGNLITDEGGAVLAEAIATSPSPFSYIIDMRENKICDPDVIHQLDNASASELVFLENQNCDAVDHRGPY